MHNFDEQYEIWAHKNPAAAQREDLTKLTDSDAQTEMRFVKNIVEEFKAFVMHAVSEGHHKNFSDHDDFLKASLEEFLESIHD